MDIDAIRDYLGDDVIVNELIQYMSTEQLDVFCEHLVDMYDLDYESVKFQ